MGVARAIDKEITNYLEHLSSKQKEVVLSVVKSFAAEEPWWNDKAYVAEMDKRLAELESGKVKGLTLDQMETGARRGYKSRKNCL